MATTKTAPKSKAVAKVKDENVLPAAITSMFEEDAGAGLDQMGKDDLAIPFIGLVQSLSPQRKKNDAKFIEGAQEGMLFNTVTNTLYDAEGAGVRVIPCGFSKKYLEFIPRDQGGGGFVAAYDSKQDAMEQAKPGNQIVDVAEHYVLIENPDGGWTQALLSMKSSQLRVSRNWNSRQQMLKVQVGENKITPPIFGTVYRLRTIEESNDKGTWYNFKVDYEGLVDNADLYGEAKQFYGIAAKAAERTQDYAKVEAAASSEADEQDGDEPAF